MLKAPNVAASVCSVLTKPCTEVPDCALPSLNNWSELGTPRSARPLVPSVKKRGKALTNRLEAGLIHNVTVKAFNAPKDTAVLLVVKAIGPLPPMLAPVKLSDLP